MSNYRSVCASGADRGLCECAADQAPSDSVRRPRGPLSRFDILAAVDDFSRVGALRLRDANGQFLRSETAFRTPQLIELDKIYAAARAVEQGTESEADLRYLQGKATSLGGLRPKCTVLDADGTLALGKFPSITDTRSIVRGEALALKLARLAGLDAAEARIEMIDGTAIAIIRRFDRTPDAARLAYLSGGSLLQARRSEDRAYTEIADALRRIGARPTEDVLELWRRMLFNFLITNVDDHLWNVGVLYAGNGQWRLAPAFDVNPFPDRARESKTWLSEETGPITSLRQLIDGLYLLRIAARASRARSRRDGHDAGGMAHRRHIKRCRTDRCRARNVRACLRA